jgi:hypothetical protein
MGMFALILRANILPAGVLMDEKEKKRQKIKYALIAFTIVSVFIFIGIFMVFAASVKNMN